ncbi:MAG: response regulator, partial [Cyanobacteria bacterium P01_C01_bin.38]
MKILLINDDEQFINQLKENLKQHRYVVDTALDGQEGWDFVEAQEYDLIVLDVMLPKLDGFTFCSRLRAKGLQVLVMFLTARAASEDKIQGLDVGADDYVVKPVPLAELTARIRAL